MYGHVDVDFMDNGAKKVWRRKSSEELARRDDHEGEQNEASDEDIKVPEATTLDLNGLNK